MLVDGLKADFNFGLNSARLDQPRICGRQVFDSCLQSILQRQAFGQNRQ